MKLRVSALLPIILSLIFVGIVGCGRPSVSSGLFVKPQEAELGVVDGNKGVISAEFEIVNQLPHTVRIAEIQAGCTCIAAKLNTHSIPANGTAKLVVQFDPAGTFGRKVNQATLVTDDRDFPRLRVDLYADVVVQHLKSETNYLIGSFWPGERIDIEVPLAIQTSQQFEVKKSGCDGLSVEFLFDSSSIRIFGNVPGEPGLFSFNVQLSGTGGEVSEEMTITFQGNCGIRWLYDRDIYLGHLNRSESSHPFQIELRQLESIGQRPGVKDVRIVSLTENISFVESNLGSDTIAMKFETKEVLDGPNEATVTSEILHNDESIETVTVNVYFFGNSLNQATE